MKTAEQRRDIVIGILTVGFAILALTVWIPLDIDTGVIDEWRRTIRIGDAMLPTFSAIGIVLAGLGLLFQSIFNSPQTKFHKIDKVFFLWLVAIIGISLMLMFITGPLLIWAWSIGEVSYRQVYHSAPWKYAGFMVGGISLTFGLISLAYKNFSWINLMTAAIAAALIAMAFSLPDESLLIPPNREF